MLLQESGRKIQAQAGWHSECRAAGVEEDGAGD